MGVWRIHARITPRFGSSCSASVKNLADDAVSHDLKDAAQCEEVRALAHGRSHHGELVLVRLEGPIGACMFSAAARGFV